MIAESFIFCLFSGASYTRLRHRRRPEKAEEKEGKERRQRKERRKEERKEEEIIALKWRIKLHFLVPNVCWSTEIFIINVIFCMP